MTLCARDVMQRDVLSVSPDMSLAELADFLIRERISGVPVVRQKELVGIVSRSDVVRLLSLDRSLAGLIAEGSEPEEFAPAEVPVPPPGERVGEELEERTVRDVMVADPITVSPDTPIVEVARLLAEHHLHRVVVREGKQVSGVISTLDLVQLIADERLRP
jgi:CBS domain-containing protein